MMKRRKTKGSAIMIQRCRGSVVGIEMIEPSWLAT